MLMILPVYVLFLYFKYQKSVKRYLSICEMEKMYFGLK